MAIPTMSITVRKAKIAKIATTQAAEERAGLSNLNRRTLTRWAMCLEFFVRAGQSAAPSSAAPGTRIVLWRVKLCIPAG
jgi:hypothetical protein